MRVIHTSDWHLGQYFIGKSRERDRQGETLPIIATGHLATVGNEFLSKLIKKTIVYCISTLAEGFTGYDVCEILAAVKQGVTEWTGQCILDLLI
ncbi:hypothetical protein [Nitrosococcus oceani]|uniref:hypothetical protein n=1 Tax=Nitrosococcus oceani TaxID=1229 RepID=UPI0004E86CAB|nr:hypothetical protein [Nitrosococcus oceani]KFI23213.1 hypothetical protein HW44_05180 [Nitrosococcus oceani]